MTRPGSFDLDPGSKGNRRISWCVSFETECTWVVIPVYRWKALEFWLSNIGALILCLGALYLTLFFKRNAAWKVVFLFGKSVDR